MRQASGSSSARANLNKSPLTERSKSRLLLIHWSPIELYVVVTRRFFVMVLLVKLEHL